MQKIVKDDVVVVRSGKYRGKSGKVLRVLTRKGMLLVEKINLVKRHSKPNARNNSGSIVEKEAPMPLSKLALLDPKEGKATRVGIRTDAAGKKARFAKRSGEEFKS